MKEGEQGDEVDGAEVHLQEWCGRADTVCCRGQCAGSEGQKEGEYLFSKAGGEF